MTSVRITTLSGISHYINRSQHLKDWQYDQCTYHYIIWN